MTDGDDDRPNRAKPQPEIKPVLRAQKPAPPMRLETFRPSDLLPERSVDKRVGSVELAHTSNDRLPLRRPRQMVTKPRWSFLRWSAVGIGGILGFALLTGSLAVATLSPADLVRSYLITAVREKMARELKLGPAAVVSFYPHPAITFRDVELSPPQGMTGAPTLKIQVLEASVDFLPLLQRDVVIEHILLTKPVIDLRIDKQGRRSWDQADAGEHQGPQTRVRFAAAPTGTASDAAVLPKDLQDFAKGGHGEPQTKPTPRLSFQDLTLKNMRIEGGTVHFSDERSGVSRKLTALNLGVTLDNLDLPLKLEGTANLEAEALAMTADVTNLRDVLNHAPFKAKLAIKGQAISLAFDGLVPAGVEPSAEGPLSIEAPSLKRLGRLLSGAPKDGKTDWPSLGPVSIKGQVQATAIGAALSAATFDLGQAHASGSIAFEQGSVRPLIKANLKLANLNLDTLLTAGAPEGGPAAAQPTSIEDLIQGPPATAAPKKAAAPTKVYGYTARNDWSDDIIDVSGLAAIDAEAKLSLAGLIVHDLVLGPTDMRLGLRNQVAKVDIDDATLYGGKARGSIEANGAATSVAVGVNLALEGVDTNALLKQAAHIEWLAGRGVVKLALTGRGASERAILKTLTGKAEIRLKDGAFLGLDVAKSLKNIARGQITGLSGVPGDRTDFTDAQATFTLANGVADGRDLSLVSQAVKVTGVGQINIPDRRIDYVLRPKVLAATDAAGGVNLAGLEVPLKVTGAWDKPDVTPDVKGIFKDPSAVLGVVGQVAKQLQSKEGQDAVKGLLGQLGVKSAPSGNVQAQAGPGDAPADPAAPAPKKKFKAEDILKLLQKP